MSTSDIPSIVFISIRIHLSRYNPTIRVAQFPCSGSLTTLHKARLRS